MPQKEKTTVGIRQIPRVTVFCLPQVVIPFAGSLVLKRKPEDGGDKTYDAMDAIVADFSSMSLHPGDLKPAVKDASMCGVCYYTACFDACPAPGTVGDFYVRFPPVETPVCTPLSTYTKLYSWALYTLSHIVVWQYGILYLCAYKERALPCHSGH